ncbi:phage holin family protein [Starkeya sp. 3C]|uniref:Phage holin family protein n=1 Tax=Ancylobacter moscoviensis TaxID=2597768 RepID=A0ABY3DV64_9HYPH|nr:phage holin family protein [Ancylobacter moscoviensis]TSJ64333.1 phage holin family protein [Ancylobacter moscoviensis]
MLRLLLAIAGAEVRQAARVAVRRTAITAALFVIGGVLLVAAFFAFLVAGFVLLAERYDPATAALIVAGFMLIVGLIFVLVALLRTRRPPARPSYGAGLGLSAAPPPASPAAAPGAAAPGPAPSGKAEPDVSTVLAIAAGAALVGLILGRRV